jgi:hypothetical protein
MGFPVTGPMPWCGGCGRRQDAPVIEPISANGDTLPEAAAEDYTVLVRTFVFC